MGEREDADTREETSGRRVVAGRSVCGHLLYSGLHRIAGGLAYYVLAGEPHTGPVAYRVVVHDRLSRSGQPGSAGWRFLRDRGVHTIVNLRLWDDPVAQLQRVGFAGYLHLPIPDGLPPTEDQAVAFLSVACDPAHWPVHVHCLSGVQRTGTMIALYRHAVEGWAMADALRSCRGLILGPTRAQLSWLARWARDHEAGSWTAGKTRRT